MPKAKLPELVSVAEIAALAGIPANTVAQWHRRGKLPAPAAQLAIGPIWTKSEIKTWLGKR